MSACATSLWRISRPSGVFRFSVTLLHAAVVGLEIGARHAGQHGRAARIVADLRHLDLDDLGAEIGHQHVGHRAGLRRRAGDDLDALQRSMWLGHVESPRLVPVSSGWQYPVLPGTMDVRLAPRCSQSLSKT